ncbi:NAD(P)/FAD-dependent oxidoreductase [Actinophytocola sediminis]
MRGTETTRERVAVVGAGVAGLTAAYLLQRRYDVLLFEAAPRLGGHADTHDVSTSDGDTVTLDTGFIVHNERTYPNLIRLFGELGVATQDTEMSMSVRCDGCGLEYAGARGLPGLFPTAAHLRRPRYLRMLPDVPRFHRLARRLLAAPADLDPTLGEFLAANGFSAYFRHHFVLPVVSAVWSAGEQLGLDYPARYLFTFLDNHGLLSVTGSPRWRTVTGGSRTYVDRAAKSLSSVHVNTPVRAVERWSGGVVVRDEADETHQVDRVVVATHPDQALRLLDRPTAAEEQVLGAFGYSTNETWLHTDASVLPRAPRARASWNYLKRTCHDDTGPAVVSYHLNRLQRLAEPADYLVTLNATEQIPASAVLARMSYQHPVYTKDSVAAQRRLPELTDRRTAFAGAYHGWGFHEDGCVAGVRAAAAFGVPW